LISNLESGVRNLSWKPSRSTWTGYYAEAESYSPEALAHKKALVAEFVTRADPHSVWDLGTNTGLFSRISSDRRIPTVSFDIDPECVEASYSEVVAKGEDCLLPLLLDLTNPSPALGWANRERMSLARRGPADMVLALALVHHLAIGNNVPLDQVAAFLRELCTWLAVEFVPKVDPKVQLLLASREDIFPEYSPKGFEHSFSASFSIERQEPISGSERTLYLLRSR
jgi:ribosomal protein L11 methylase PrmA